MARMKVLNGPSIRRMPIYLYWLSVMQARGDEFASTTQLAEYIDLEPINVRKDIALTGVTGTVGVGYRVGDLIAGIRRYLGWDAMRPACLVGVMKLSTPDYFKEFIKTMGSSLCGGRSKPRIITSNSR